MPTDISIAEQVWNLFLAPKGVLRESFLRSIADLINADIPEDEKPVVFFSDFNQRHKQRVTSLRNRFNEIMLHSPDEADGLQKVIDIFQQLIGKENPDLLFYAFQSFVVHHKGEINLLVPSLLVRDPELLPPSKTSTEIQPEIAVGSADETKMDWFREDPLLNEHHTHWHIVYYTDVYRDRQGEMFFYMHQQMLARYDTERLCLGLKQVKSFNDFANQIIDAGYRAGDDERLNGFDSRPANASIAAAEAQQQVTFLKRALTDINNKTYDLNPAAADPILEETRQVNLLGATLEPNNQALPKKYQGYHGLGHMIISRANGTAHGGGVMRTTVTAIRDVVFWQWHRSIDDLYFSLQKRMPVNDFNLHAAPVVLRKSVDAQGKPYTADIIICLAKDVPGYAQPGFDGKSYGMAVFGGNSWSKDFAISEGTFDDAVPFKTTNTLNTHMHTGTIKYRSQGQNKQYDYPYLNHDEFCYFIRVENTSLQEKRVTVRVFLVAEGHEEDRRLWIEMDKFLHTLPAKAKEVIFRKDRESSVIRKPAITDPSTHNTVFDPVNIGQNGTECDCGWPYHLLLPRGIKENNGMPFRLFTMITDGDVDLVGGEPDCGSLSFCGTRTDNYPDKRPLGYPFNRSFAVGATPVSAAIMTTPQMAMRTIYIKQIS